MLAGPSGIITRTGPAGGDDGQWSGKSNNLIVFKK